VDGGQRDSVGEGGHGELRQLHPAHSSFGEASFWLRRGPHDQRPVGQPRSGGATDRLLHLAGVPEGHEGLVVDRQGRRAERNGLSPVGRLAQEQRQSVRHQDQAFPKKEADGYFAIQSDVLQGTTAPADAAKKMQAIIAAWQK
jgi:hypothetical protein